MTRYEAYVMPAARVRNKKIFGRETFGMDSYIPNVRLQDMWLSVYKQVPNRTVPTCKLTLSPHTSRKYVLFIEIYTNC